MNMEYFKTYGSVLSDITRVFFAILATSVPFESEYLGLASLRTKTQLYGFLRKSMHGP